MMLSLLLLLLLGSSCRATFLGTVLTYYPKTTVSNETAAVVLHSRTGSNGIFESSWLCNYGDCGTEISNSNNMITLEIFGNWLEVENIWTLLVPSNALFQMWMKGEPWENNVDGISVYQAAAVIDLRKRSDTNKANSSPLTAIIPLLRVPSNCQRDFNLLAFDPDGDDVRCRYGNASLLECYNCTQPSFLNLSSSCTLSFSPNNSVNEGWYIVQMVMEDFPKQNITMTQADGSQVVKTNNDAISKIPVQFVVSVDPAVQSCTEGLYLPRILTPIPDRLYTFVNQPVIINITAEVLNSTFSQVLYSGPYTININTLLPGQYIMSWTPTEDNGGESQPICFVVEATNVLLKYHSELRCVIVTVGNESIIIIPPPTPPTPPPTTTTTISYSNKAVVGLSIRVSSSLSLDDIRNTITQLIKNELTILGLSYAALDIVNIVTNTTNTGG